jgi:ankyrin repeat protein
MTFDELQILIKKDDIISLRRELDAGVSPNLSNQFAWNLLMLAAIKGSRSIGELLISKGADVNATNDFGETALSLAANGGHTSFNRTLLANGASTDCHPHGTSLEHWLRASSALPPDKIESILDLINSASPRGTR